MADAVFADPTLKSPVPLAKVWVGATGLEPVTSEFALGALGGFSTVSRSKGWPYRRSMLSYAPKFPMHELLSPFLDGVNV